MDRNIDAFTAKNLPRGQTDKIDDHINYLMIRYDADKVTPLKSEAQSKEYLSKPALKAD